MTITKHILVIRFSALGDVAMTVPVIKQVLQQNPDTAITIVSSAHLQPLFTGLERCHFYPAYLKGVHKGVMGMFKLYKELKSLYKFTAIADLHNVLRSKILNGFFKLSGYQQATIDKGRKAKKLLTQKENKLLQQLPTSFERYALVFNTIGLQCTLTDQQPVYTKQPIPTAAQYLFTENGKVIGIAPFAHYKEKMYPLEKMEQLVTYLSQQEYTILLFGGGSKETAILQNWQNQSSKHVYNMAGQFSFADELAIISNLSQMISMDSANMHLASLYGIAVISIWGATHPFAGFYGWGQSKEQLVSVNLPCSPCSVFGNKPCYRGDNACMNQIKNEMIIGKIT